MNVLYEEDGTFKVGSILADNTTSLQVEATHGKRSKIKSGNVLLHFQEPPLAEFMKRAESTAAEIDTDFLWECCPADEFGFADMARDYHGHSPTPIEAAGVLLKLHAVPVYFHRKGKGRYRAAPAETLKAALAGLEKKRQQQQQMDEWVAEMKSGALPPALQTLLPELLYKPDRNRIETKAMEQACAELGVTAAKLAERCGALPSTHAFHLNRFLFEQFPKGVAFADFGPLAVPPDLPLAEVQAFSIDDITTTEIDDAFSVTRLADGLLRIGIHIAAPALAPTFTPGSLLDIAARERLSTVYMPGGKITMLPESLIAAFSLEAGRVCPAISLYLDVNPADYTVIAHDTRIEQVPIAANLRLSALEPHFDALVADANTAFPFGEELDTLWHLVNALETARGKPSVNAQQLDYSFYVDDDRVSILQRVRGAPLDKLVSELMIYANSFWGGELARGGVAAIYRAQSNGKVRITTVAAPHQGLGVEQYAWSSSPLRRYIDLVNQWQLVASLRDEVPPFGTVEKPTEALMAIMREFELAYAAYDEFQRGMERYWCLRWLLQAHPDGTMRVNAIAIRENLARLVNIPLVLRVAGLPERPPGTRIEIEISNIDLLESTANTKLLRELDVEPS